LLVVVPRFRLGKQRSLQWFVRSSLAARKRDLAAGALRAVNGHPLMSSVDSRMLNCAATWFK
jgi:hypothetical protein